MVIEDRDESRARRYGGVARLYGDAALVRFATSRVAVVGLGGVGSWAAEALVRSGIGALTLIDLDHIAESNINRQLHAIERDIGRAKVDAMAERAASIDASCQLRSIDEFLNADNVDDLLSGCDAVLDAVDDVRAKAAMIVWCRDRRVPIVVAGAAGGQRDATAIRRADLSQTRNDALLSKLRSRLRREHGFPKASLHGKPRPFDVPAVYVDAPPAPAPAACEPGAPLNCAGYGSVVHMTAALGFAASGVLLDRLSSSLDAGLTSTPRSTTSAGSD